MYMFGFLGYIYHPSQGASHKRRFRLGFPILKLECHPGGDWHPGRGGTSKPFFARGNPRKKNALDLHQV